MTVAIVRPPGTLAVAAVGAGFKPAPARLFRRRVLLLLMLAASTWQIGEGLWIPVKAWLAQILIARAWETAMATDEPAPPWPWADTTPVARLTVPALGVDQIVLAHATGRTLAFGPGHLDGSAVPGDPGLSVISGHRDTSFRFLADVTEGTAIRLQRKDGVWVNYRVTSSAVVDERTTRLASPTGGTPRLALTTCYPFDAILPGGPLRYVVWAEAVEVR